MAVRSVDYVILFVRDLDAAAAFYRDVLEVPFKFAEQGYAEFDTEGTRLALFERARLSGLIRRRATDGGPTGAVVFLVEDVDAWAERLRAAGVPVLAGPVDHPWGHRTVHIEDPDGHIVELAQEIPRTRPRSPSASPVRPT